MQRSERNSQCIETTLKQNAVLVIKSRRKFNILLCVVSILFTNTGANAAGGQDPGETIEIIGATIAGRLDENPQSGYNLLFKRLLPSETHYFKFQQYPLRRAMRKFEQSKRVCLVPASITTITVLSHVGGEDLVESDPIDLVSSHFLTAPNTVPITSVQMLAGKRLAVRQGVALGHFDDPALKIELIRPPTEITAINMLLAGRVDAIYGWVPDIQILADRHKLPLPTFDPELALFKSTIHVVCRKFGGMEDLMKIVNLRLKALKESKELQKILNKHARIIE